MYYYIIRLIKEDTYRVYYSTENSKEYHEYEAQFLDIGEEYVPGIKQIITSYPDFISVKELPIETDDEKVIRHICLRYLIKRFVYDLVINMTLNIF